MSMLKLLSVCLADGGETPSLRHMSPIYTQTNLHPDETRARLYSVNFQQAGLIPAGTEVVFASLNEKQFSFIVKEKARTYYYLNHKQSNEPFESHLLRFFGPSWDPEKITRLPDQDREGVRTGKPAVGMTREGIILAMGWPPRLENPDLKASRWRYWRHRFDTIAIEFGPDDTVVNIFT
ncbi:MAG: hypothetical protein JXD23_01520 [Spirochaetales bacterium]|nr:hypothetical protein [Spirochaetales bacterium]